MELPIYKYTGEALGHNVKLSDNVFGINPVDHAMYLDVRLILANKRQGTHKTKEKGEITASTRKIRKQKGSGNARVGSIKSPIFRGGGRIFGPKPRDYSFKLNKKIKQLARKSALSYKAKNNLITILDPFSFKSPKTKYYLEMLQKFSLNNVKTILVLDKYDQNISLSCRNLQLAKITTADSLNTYDILNTKQLIIQREAIKILEKKLS